MLDTLRDALTLLQVSLRCASTTPADPTNSKPHHNGKQGFHAPSLAGTYMFLRYSPPTS